MNLGVRRAAKKLGAIVHPSLDISKGAMKAIEVLITDLNQRIVTTFLKNCKTGRKKKSGLVKEDAAQKVIEEMLPGFLRKCAIAEAHKYLAKFAAGYCHSSIHTF
ncbi:hypothetical protein NPIL_557051 [Nephila pilipes]|uniref:Uncharacterized protein n=1 Tax=Nephila pilipes TaxID=299642 RepID=A0A8X6PEB9_NEPPI|nr:hypothetical protein NPIL_557051 [Nephila pilipes]